MGQHIRRTSEIRQAFFDFFEARGHLRLPSAPLVPQNDPTVLFTPAGMNPFKDCFLGRQKPPAEAVVSCQKCLRANDIDKVGIDMYKHTFFEMLGNFSFGKYSKRDAIAWAWQFLTDSYWLGLNPSRISVSVYRDDTETYDIWHDVIGLPADRITPGDASENFWPPDTPERGPDGLCGPCTEIFYEYLGRQVEIWNLVFTQYNRVGDPPDNLRPIPSMNIDTGMGLERIAAIMQGVPSVFETDVFHRIINSYKLKRPLTCAAQPAVTYLCRIADHIRACVFITHEGLKPGPKKAKYVLKQLLRRAVMAGFGLGEREPFLHLLIQPVTEAMIDFYPELRETASQSEHIIFKAEQDFFGVLRKGEERVNALIASLSGARIGEIPGAVAFDLFQTHGFPIALVELLAADHGMTVDHSGFTAACVCHAQRSGSDPTGPRTGLGLDAGQ